MLSEIHVEKKEGTVKIEWQTAEIYIPLREIIEVTDDYASYKNCDHIVNIGISFYKSKAVVIKTKKLCYVLFSMNKNAILNEINL
ncbi:hypothetical protein COC69_31330 [Bacillus cereus]|uniref:Sublancin immunity protein SunI-like PH domain-containing protein n=1 Tax=Bacillus cereus TaxID=1396 RepID=A0A9X7GSY3_BACCE|nr:hypothetical protein [Bacillus cereus]PGS63643.1 hypothetical protein COC69_31330 [Bacillus cereus]